MNLPKFEADKLIDCIQRHYSQLLSSQIHSVQNISMSKTLMFLVGDTFVWRLWLLHPMIQSNSGDPLYLSVQVARVLCFCIKSSLRPLEKHSFKADLWAALSSSSKSFPNDRRPLSASVRPHGGRSVPQQIIGQWICDTGCSVIRFTFSHLILSSNFNHCASQSLSQEVPSDASTQKLHDLLKYFGKNKKFVWN